MEADTRGGTGLSDEHRRAVRDIVRAVLPDAEVRVFGSRAIGRARPFSDLDLLFVRPPRLGWAERAALRDLFEASALPFLVDLVDDEGLPPGMRARVASESVPL